MIDAFAQNMFLLHKSMQRKSEKICVDLLKAINDMHLAESIDEDSNTGKIADDINRIKFSIYLGQNREDIMLEKLREHILKISDIGEIKLSNLHKEAEATLKLGLIGSRSLRNEEERRERAYGLLPAVLSVYQEIIFHEEISKIESIRNEIIASMAILELKVGENRTKLAKDTIFLMSRVPFDAIIQRKSKVEFSSLIDLNKSAAKFHIWQALYV